MTGTNGGAANPEQAVIRIRNDYQSVEHGASRVNRAVPAGIRRPEFTGQMLRQRNLLLEAVVSGHTEVLE
jgi:hypothetical protein